LRGAEAHPDNSAARAIDAIADEKTLHICSFIIFFLFVIEEDVLVRYSQTVVWFVYGQLPSWITPY
jgi:hypothetical protein